MLLREEERASRKGGQKETHRGTIDRGSHMSRDLISRYLRPYLPPASQGPPPVDLSLSLSCVSHPHTRSR